MQRRALTASFPTIRDVIVILSAAAAFELAGVPAGAMIGALLATSVLQLRGYLQLSMPPAARNIALAGIGWMLGARLDGAAITSLRASLGPVTAGLVLLLAGCWLLGHLLERFTALDRSTAFLAMTPGGITEMASFAHVGRGQPHVVAAAHLMRVVVIVVVTPALASVANG